MSVFECKYAFQAGNAAELSFGKGDRLVLVEKKTKSWWKCSNEDKAVGMVPSNYLGAVEEAVADMALEERPSLAKQRSSRRLSLRAPSGSGDGDAGAMSPCGASVEGAGFRLEGAGVAVYKDGVELVRFDAALRAVADDDGAAAIAADDVLYDAGFLGGAVEEGDATSVGAWLRACLGAEPLKPLVISFLTGAEVTGEFEVNDRARVRARVLFDFNPSSDSELALVVGEFVFVDVAGVEPAADLPAAAAIAAAAKDGWVKGVSEISGLAGYFPLAYVEAAPEGDDAPPATATTGTTKAPSPPTPAKKKPDRTSRAYSVKSRAGNGCDIGQLQRLLSRSFSSRFG